MSLSDEALKMLQEMQRTMGQSFIPDEKLHDIFDHDVEWLKSQFADDAEVMMTFGIHGKHREKDEWMLELVVMADWPPENKQRAMMGLGVKFHEDYPDYMPLAVSQISEAWVSHYKNDVPKDRPMPSEDPNRMEAAFVHTITMDQRQDMQMFKINRDNDTVKLEPLEEMAMRHDPAALADPRKQTNYLTLDFFMGYFSSLERKS